MDELSSLTDQEIRIAVAKWAGYRVISYENGFYLVDPNKTLDQVMRALGQNFYAKPWYTSEELVWNSARYPEYHRDLNACFLLLSSFGCNWYMSKHNAVYSCIIALPDTPNENLSHSVYSDSISACRAICEAFLMWQDMQEIDLSSYV